MQSLTGIASSRGVLVLFRAFRNYSPGITRYEPDPLKALVAAVAGKYMNQPEEPFQVGQHVRVVKPKASVEAQQRRYKVVRVNPALDMLQLEWVDAPKDAKDRYLWVLKDLVRKV